MKSNFLYVISGGPCTGKSSVINSLKKKGYKTVPETARQILNSYEKFKGKTYSEINILDLQNKIFEIQKKIFYNLKKKKNSGIVFLDRGIVDCFAYYKAHNLEIVNEKIEQAKKIKYKKIFILDLLNFYEKDVLRKEDKAMQEKIHKLLIETYKDFDYKPVIVPFMEVEKRVDFILSYILKGGSENEI